VEKFYRVVVEVALDDRTCPTVVLFSFLDPLLAVMALATRHASDCTGDVFNKPECRRGRCGKEAAKNRRCIVFWVCKQWSERLRRREPNSPVFNAEIFNFAGSPGIPSQALLMSVSEICRHSKMGLTLEPIPGFMLSLKGQLSAIGRTITSHWHKL
jgi:hypothetical protein